MTQTRAAFLVLLAALIWGVAFYFQKTAMTDIGPFLFLSLRAAIAAAVLAPFALAEKTASDAPAGRLLPFIGLGGLTFLTAAGLQQSGIVTATVTNTSFLTALYVVFTPFLIWAIRGEKPAARVVGAVALALLGTWGLTGGALTALSGGDWLVAASALFWAAHMLVTQRAGAWGRPLTFTCGAFAVVAVLAFTIAAATESLDWSGVWAALPAVLYVGVLSSALTFGLFAIALRHLPASRAAILLSTEALFAALAGAALLGERLTLFGWLGAALILAAVLVVQIGPKLPK